MLDTLARALAVAGVAITVVSLLFSVRTARRESRIRRGLEIGRIVLGAAGAVVIGMIGTVSTPLALAVVGVGAGCALGYAQGRTVEVFLRDGVPYSRRTLLGVAVWFLSLIAMQLAGALNRTGVFRVGQALALFGIATALGVLLGRNKDPERPPGAALGHGATAIGAIAVIASAVLSTSGTLVPHAGAQSPGDDLPELTEEVCAELEAENELFGCVFHSFDLRYSPGGDLSVFGDTGDTPLSGAGIGDDSQVVQRLGGGLSVIFAAGDVVVRYDGGVGVAEEQVVRDASRILDALQQTSAAAPNGSSTGSSEECEFAVECLDDPPECTLDDEGNCIVDDNVPETAPGTSPTDSGSQPGLDDDSGDGGLLDLDGGSISPEEALAQSIAAVLVAVAMGAMSSAEAAELISQALALARGGDVDAGRRLIDEALRGGTRSEPTPSPPDPTGAPEPSPPPHPGDGPVPPPDPAPPPGDAPGWWHDDPANEPAPPEPAPQLEGGDVTPPPPPPRPTPDWWADDDGGGHAGGEAGDDSDEPWNWDRSRQEQLAEQAEQGLLEDAGRRLPLMPMLDDLDAIKDRIRDGSATPEDLIYLQGMRDLAAAANEARRGGEDLVRQTSDRWLQAADGYRSLGLMTGKAAAERRLGPAGGFIVTSVVDTIANRHQGWDRAALTGVTNAALDAISSGVAGKLEAFGELGQVSGSGFLNGVSAATQVYLEEYIAHRGDESKIDMDRVWEAGRSGAAVGTLFGGARIGDARQGLLDAAPGAGRSGPSTRVGPDAPPAPGDRSTRIGTDPPSTGTRTSVGPDAPSPTNPRTTVGPDAPARGGTPTGAGTPPPAATLLDAAGGAPRPSGPETGVGRPPSSDAPASRPSPYHRDDRPANTRPLDEVARTGRGAPEVPDDVPAPPRSAGPIPGTGAPIPGPRDTFADARWREFDADGAGNVYDKHGNHLFTLRENGTAVDHDGRFVTPLRNEIDGPVGYVDAQGRQIAFDRRGRPEVLRDRTWDESYPRELGDAGHPVDGLDPNFGWGPAREPAPDVTPARATMRNSLTPTVQSRWSGAAAGPNGELYGPNGTVVGAIDQRGRMTTLDGREITGYRRVGNRLASVRTADGDLLGDV